MRFDTPVYAILPGGDLTGRLVLFSLLLFGLSACSTFRSALMTPPPPRTALPAVPPQSEPRPRPRTEATAPAPAERKVAVVAPDPERLIGLNPDMIGGVLGRPDNRSKDDMAFEWTYKGSRCALQLYFYPDVKTGAMRVLKYKFRHRAGATNDRHCLSTIMAVKK